MAFFRLFLLANIMNVAQWTEQVCQALLEAAVHFGHGTDNARDEAVWLVLSAIDEPVDGHFCDWDRELIESEEQQVSSLLQARITQKVPLAYLTGRARFAGLEFESGQGALVQVASGRCVPVPSQPQGHGRHHPPRARPQHPLPRPLPQETPAQQLVGC